MELIGKYGCWGVGVGITGMALAAAVAFGSGAAQADAGDDGSANTAAATSADSAADAGDHGTGSSTGLTGLLSVAASDFGDAKGILSGVDTSGLPDGSQLPTIGLLGEETPLLDNAIDNLGSLQSAETEMSAHTGGLSGIFDSLNQEWANAAESVLHDDDNLASAINSGSDISVLLAQGDLLGDFFTQVVPAAIESDLIEDIAGSFGSVTDSAGLF